MVNLSKKIYYRYKRAQLYKKGSTIQDGADNIRYVLHYRGKV